MMYLPSSSPLERLRSLFKRRVGDADLAYLGDSHGEGARVDVPGTDDYVYVHFATGGVDENGFAIYSTPQMAWVGNVAYPNVPGCPVYVGIGYSDILEIKAVHPRGLRQAGISARVLNPLNQQSKFVYLWQLTMGLANAVGTTASASFLVTIKSFRHYVGNIFQTFETPGPADMVDLEPYVPAADMHCYAAIWLDTYTNLPVVTTSTAQALTIQMDLTDIQELTVNRPADAIPLKAFHLSNDQTSVRASAQDTELRQVLNTPQLWGFPNILSHLERVWPNRTLVTGPYTVSGVGAIALESGAQIIIVHKNNFIATTAPGTGDDSADGYSIGSLWFDTATGLLYVATSVSVGAATWGEVTASGGGTMSSWSVGAEAGTDETVTNGQLVDFLGGAGIDTVVSAPRTVTASVDSTVIRTSGTQSIGVGLTLTAPVIADYTNANHDHLDPDDGGTLTTAIFGTTTQNWVLIGQISGTGVPTFRGLVAADLAAALASPPSIGGTTPATGYFSALRLYISGVAAIFTHAFTANRTVTFPGDANVTLVGEATTQTLSAKTLTAPTIADYTNAQHDHADADGGGQLTGAAFTTQTANTIFAGPTTGAAATPTFRALVLADVPNLIAILRDEKASGTAGGTSSTTTWNARDLNTESYDPGSIVAISSNQFTPIAGDYEIWALTSFLGGTAAASTGRCRLYNVTGAAAVEEGLTTFAMINGPGTAPLNCKFTANGTDAYRIDTYTSVGRATTGLGTQAGDGSAEVYTMVELRKIV